jgi:dihydroxy-acid dehydratase
VDAPVSPELGAEYWSGTEAAVRRTIYRGTGLGDDIADRPHIGIVNAYTDASPAYTHLRGLAEAVKTGVWAAGGIPFEFGTFATCGNIGLGSETLKYELVIRDALAGSIEIMASVHHFAGLVLLASTDSVIPGHILGALRLNRPTLFVTGGPMLSGHWRGRSVTAMHVNEAVFGGLPSGAITPDELKGLEDSACPTAGACPVMGTANTMQILTEPLGLALPATATIPAVMVDKVRAAHVSGRRIVDLVRQGRRVGDVLDGRALRNALIVDLAIGGSTNAVLHLLSFARELGLPLTLDDFDELSRVIPCLSGVLPNGPHTVDQFHQAGGVPQLMKHLGDLLDGDAVSADGRPWRSVLERVDDRPSSVIATRDKPRFADGGLSVLRGNLAPSGAIIRQSAVPSEMQRHTGPAICFDSDRSAYEAVIGGRVRPGSVVIVRYQGPRGAPGMVEVMLTSDALTSTGRNRDTALITDGRFSGFNHGPIVGHIDPEAAVGGPIALIEDGDIIEIDVQSRRLELHVEARELERRRASWRPPERFQRIGRGILGLYAMTALPASEGAAMQPWTETSRERELAAV